MAPKRNNPGPQRVKYSPCRTPSVRPPTSNRRPQGGHPCIERMRDAQRRSNALRPLQSRFKARKKPEGYTSTLTGSKRLKTAKYGVSRQRERKGDAIRRPPTYTQAQTHSCKRRVRRFLFWWSCGELNPGPMTEPSVFYVRSLLAIWRFFCPHRCRRQLMAGISAVKVPESPCGSMIQASLLNDAQHPPKDERE